MPGSDHFYGDADPDDISRRPDAKSAGDGPVADRDLGEIANALREKVEGLEAEREVAAIAARQAQEAGDPEAMPVDLDEPAGDSDQAEPIDRAALRRRIAEQLHKASPPANDIDIPMELLSPGEREPYETAADMVLDVMPASVQILTSRIHQAERLAQDAQRRAERTEREYEDLQKQLKVERQRRSEAEDQGLDKLIETRAERAALRSDARTLQTRAVQALAEYLRDGSVSHVGRKVARPWLTGEHGQSVDVDGEPVRDVGPPSIGAVDRIEPPMDPERVRALAFAVAAGNEAVDSVRNYVRDSLERKAFALQLTGQLDDVVADIERLLERHQLNADDDPALAEHMTRTRDIIRELDTGYDAPSWDRGISL